MRKIKSHKFEVPNQLTTADSSLYHGTHFKVRKIFLYTTLVSLFSVSLGSALVTLDEIFGLAMTDGSHYSWPNPNLLELGTSNFLVRVPLWSSWEIDFVWIVASAIGLAVCFGLVFYNLREGAVKAS